MSGGQDDNLPAIGVRLDVAPSLSVLILTYNEEIHIERALASIGGIARDVVVVDSGSTDRTVQIARSMGARVLTHPFVNYAKQFRWGMDHAGFTTDWIMRLDADEIIEPDLAEEIRRELPILPAKVTGVSLRRKHIFMGRWVRHGGRFPLTMVRIWRRGLGQIEDRWMDEHIVLSNGVAATFYGGFADANLNDLTFFTDKHNRYATREAIDVIGRRYGLFRLQTDLRDTGVIDRAGGKRFLKEAIYNRLPFQLSALLYFLYRYVIQLGFLDGGTGLIYHALQGGWYRFLVGAKVLEFERALSNAHGDADRRAILSKLTGYDLTAADAGP